MGPDPIHSCRRRSRWIVHHGCEPHRLRDLATKKGPSDWMGPFSFRESGTDLLSRGIPRTIIGAAPFHGPVRDGKAWFQSALGTRHSSEFHRSPHGGDETSSSKEAGWDCQA